LPLIGSEFLPPSDEGEVRVSGKMEIGTRLELVDHVTFIWKIDNVHQTGKVLIVYEDTLLAVSELRSVR
jgi:hypothetical protein